MPITTLPTKTDGSIGRTKRDVTAGLAVDLDTQVPAAEWERLKDWIVALASEVGLSDGSTPGSLRAAIAAAASGNLWTWNEEDVSEFANDGNGLVLAGAASSATLAAVSGFDGMRVRATIDVDTAPCLVVWPIADLVLPTKYEMRGRIREFVAETVPPTNPAPEAGFALYAHEAASAAAFRGLLTLAARAAAGARVAIAEGTTLVEDDESFDLPPFAGEATGGVGCFYRAAISGRRDGGAGVIPGASAFFAGSPFAVASGGSVALASSVPGLTAGNWNGAALTTAGLALRATSTGRHVADFSELAIAPHPSA